MNNASIGVFDSGVGGLTVVKEIKRWLPNESIVYFGDTLRVPYGSRSVSQLLEFARQNLNFLLSLNVKAIAIACNTISANCMTEINREYEIPIIEVLGPGVETVAKQAKKNVGVIATEAAIKSGAHIRLFSEQNSNLSVFTKFCPLLVPIVEEGLADTEIAYSAAEWYLSEFREIGIDTLLLGCTHYPVLLNAIKKTLPDVSIVDPAGATAVKLAETLDRLGLRADGKQAGDRFFVSGDTVKFNAVSKNILFGEMSEIAAEKVNIAGY